MHEGTDSIQNVSLSIVALRDESILKENFLQCCCGIGHLQALAKLLIYAHALPSGNAACLVRATLIYSSMYCNSDACCSTCRQKTMS